MIGYKGLDKNFCCRGFQYEVGKTYQFDYKIIICKSGFHFCDAPLAVFEYYPPADSRFALIEATEPCDNEGHKFCTSQITILEELTLEQLLEYAKKDCLIHNSAELTLEEVISTQHLSQTIPLYLSPLYFPQLHS